jgi:hypothetical protein
MQTNIIFKIKITKINLFFEIAFFTNRNNFFFFFKEYKFIKY